MVIVPGVFTSQQGLLAAVLQGEQLDEAAGVVVPLRPGVSEGLQDTVHLHIITRGVTPPPHHRPDCRHRDADSSSPSQTRLSS